MPITEKQLKNLHPIKKGEVRNPKGRGKGHLNIKTIAKKVLNKEISMDDPLLNKKVKRSLAEHGITAAAVRWIKEGDNAAGKEVLDRAYGRAAMPVEMTVDKEGITETAKKLTQIFGDLFEPTVSKKDTK